MTTVAITPPSTPQSEHPDGGDTAHPHLSRDRCLSNDRCDRYDRWLSRDRYDRCQFKKPYHYAVFEQRVRQESHPTSLQPAIEHLVVATRPGNSLPLRERSLRRSLQLGARTFHLVRRETPLSACQRVVSSARTRISRSLVGGECCHLTTHDRPTLTPDRWLTCDLRSVLRSRENPPMSEHRSRDVVTARTWGVIPEVGPLDQPAHPIREGG